MEIPNSLVIDWDQTGIQYIPVSKWTMEGEGLKRVEITSFEKKQQITAVFGATMDGDFLPPQLIYAGKTFKGEFSSRLRCDIYSGVARPGPTRACALLSTSQALPSPTQLESRDSTTNQTKVKK